MSCRSPPLQRLFDPPACVNEKPSECYQTPLSTLLHRLGRFRYDVKRALTEAGETRTQVERARGALVPRKKVRHGTHANLTLGLRCFFFLTKDHPAL